MFDFNITPMIIAIPVFFSLILLEMFVAWRKEIIAYSFQDTITSMNTGILSQFVNSAGAIIKITMYGLAVSFFGIFTWDLSSPLTWISALLLYDFCYYWVHRSGHEVNLLWGAHITHHSSEEFNLSTGVRQASTGFWFKWVFYLPLAVLGYPLQVFIIVGLIDLLYQFWVHTQLIGKLGWVEKIFMTPSNHRVHHGQNDYCIDKNYGGIFILWDRIFNTYAEERDDQPVVYGIRSPLKSWNPVWSNLHHYKEIWKKIQASSNLKESLYSVFAPPAWSPAKLNSAMKPLLSPQQKFSSDTPNWARAVGILFTIIFLSLLVLYLGTKKELPSSYLWALSTFAVVFVGLAGQLWSRKAWQG
jgi:alkylglycerol monooxygenase